MIQGVAKETKKQKAEREAEENSAEEDVASPEEIAEELNAPITDQDEALLDYRVSGINRGYVDPGRDQEPDISPEFGSAPHPELFNPDASELGSIGAQTSDDPRTLPEDERELPEDVEKNAETQSVGEVSEPDVQKVAIVSVPDEDEPEDEEPSKS